jgi:hypothetical protein
MRLDFSKKGQRFAVGWPVAKESQCFTDDIPGDVERGADGSGLFAELLGRSWLTSCGSKQA